MLSQQRIKQKGQGIKIGHGRPHGYQDIHVGAAAFQAFEAAHIIIPARVELYRGGQGQKQPIHPRRVAPLAQETKVPTHAEQKKGRCKNNAHQEFACLVPDLGVPCQLFRIFAAGIVRPHRTETRPFNGRNHLFHTGHGGHICHRRPLSGKINVNVLNPRYLLDGPLQIGRAIDAGHAGNGKGKMDLLGHFGLIRCRVVDFF